MKALFGGETQYPGASSDPQNVDPVDAPPTTATDKPSPTRAASGAVKAMGLTLTRVTREMEDARALREELERGERVVAVEPALIDPSPVRDRLVDPQDEAFEALVESMRETGQQVPVLLRPHPDVPGRYQSAYGHRRIRAAASIGQPVRAIVRSLSDSELVLAQGKENSERRNLSFIERAHFADALMRHGFDRATVQQALSLDKAEMTRLLHVAEAIPAKLAAAIGPAPKIGRPRWMGLAALVAKPKVVEAAHRFTLSETFRAAASDDRFALLLAHLDAANNLAAGSKRVRIVDRSGEGIAFLADGARPTIAFEKTVKPGFASFVAERLPELAEEFASRNSSD
nr:plasmid partitioning protein RepB [Aliihoeflea sp. 40Bstr573]